MTLEYDPETCWTAGELRVLYDNIPDHIPACAWVPKHSMCMTNVETEKSVSDPNAISCVIEFEFTQPFRWLEATFTLEK